METCEDLTLRSRKLIQRHLINQQHKTVNILIKQTKRTWRIERTCNSKTWLYSRFQLDFTTLCSNLNHRNLQYLMLANHESSQTLLVLLQFLSYLALYDQKPVHLTKFTKSLNFHSTKPKLTIQKLSAMKALEILLIKKHGK